MPRRAPKGALPPTDVAGGEHLLHRRIVRVSAFSGKDYEDRGWVRRPYDPVAFEIELDDGSTLELLQDAEGNGPATVFWWSPTGEQVLLGAPKF